jgi:hypothetical protein
VVIEDDVHIQSANVYVHEVMTAEKAGTIRLGVVSTNTTTTQNNLKILVNGTQVMVTTFPSNIKTMACAYVGELAVGDVVTISTVGNSHNKNNYADYFYIFEETA